MVVEQLGNQIKRYFLRGLIYKPEFPWCTVESTPGKRDMKSADKKKVPIKNTISPMGPSQTKLVFRKNSQDSCCCWGKCWSSLLLEDSKKRKKNPETNEIKKTGEKTKHKTREKLVGHTYQPQWHQPAVWSSKDFSKKKKQKQKLMPCFIPSLFIRVFMKQYVVQVKSQSHRRYLPEHWSVFSN